MARFNAKPNGTKPVNYEGAEAYKPSDKLALMLHTMSFMMSGDSYYTKEKQTSDAILNLVKRISVNDPEYVPKLAAYARNEMYLRTVPVFLLVEYAKAGTKLEGAYKYVSSILRRADEPAEAIAYFLASSPINPEVEAKRKASLEAQGKKYVPKTFAPIPGMLKKGISDALNQFDEYQLAKYNREGKVTLKDVIFLTHPKPKSAEQQVLYDKIINGTLETPFTWETHISKNGASKRTWEEVIPKMGYMALLRNLRNFQKHDVDMNLYLKRLTDPVAVRKSKQFPYRFFSAYREVGGPTKVLDAINDAMTISVENVPRISGKTFIASDNSGSMHSDVSDKSTVQCIDIASLFSAISLHVCEEATVGAFGQTYKTVPLSKRDSILTNMQKVATTDVGHSTNAWLAITDILSKNQFYDRIFLFSDMQCYNSYGYGSDVQDVLKQYRMKVNPNCRLYSFDVSSYGLLKIPESDPLTCPISGYSDAVFKFVPMFEADRGTMLKDIEHYTFLTG